MVDATESGRTVQCVVVTPERAVLDEQVDFVAIPMYDGELGVLPGRAALIGRLGAGELRTRRGQQVKRYYVDGGFAQVRDDVVTVLTPRAMPAEEINPDETNRALAAAMTVAHTVEGQEAQLKAQERARIQLRIANRVRGEDHFS